MKKSAKTTLKLKLADVMEDLVRGHVLIKYKDTGEVLLNKKNAIHSQNMARVIARGLANETNHAIYKMVFGNGGTNIDAGLNIVYLDPNVTGTSATIYNKTYEEVVDDNDVAVDSNSVISAASSLPAITSQVVITVTLNQNEPDGQASSDGITTDPDAPFVFDELGLESSDGTPLLLSHIIFAPIEKTANRSIVITYTLTIAVA